MIDNPVYAGVIGLILLLIFILPLKIPVGFSLGASGIIGIILFKGFGGTLSNVVATQPYSMGTTYVLVAIPLFVMMGWFIAEARISPDLFMTAHNWIGWIRGGMAMAVVVACAFLAAVVGSAMVAAATVTPIALGEMRKYNYGDKLSTGVCAAASNLGPLIPPSIIFIIYGFITETSIAHLFTAGIGSGVLMAVMFMGITYVWCVINPKMGPSSPRVPFREMLKIQPGFYICVIIIVICLGGIYTGFTTPTEAGALGAFVAMVFGFATRRMKAGGFVRAVSLTASTTGMIFLLIFGSMIFASMLALSTIPHWLVEILSPMSKWVVLAGLLIVLIILGFFIDIMPVILIIVPTLWPTLMAFHFDPVWLGVLVCITILMGSITPPFGTIVFVLSGIVRDVPMWDIFMGAFPYFIAMIVTLILLIIFPDICMFLVHTMYT
jgi:tripartite ATP-independent transporter DctM subunit